MSDEIGPAPEILSTPPEPETQKEAVNSGETPVQNEKADRISALFESWKDGFIDDENRSAQQKRDDFFLDISDKDIVQMCKLDAENPLTVMDGLMQQRGAGRIPPLPSLNHVMRAFDDNRQTICDEVCRAVRRGRVT